MIQTLFLARSRDKYYHLQYVPNLQGYLIPPEAGPLCRHNVKYHLVGKATSLFELPNKLAYHLQIRYFMRQKGTMAGENSSMNTFAKGTSLGAQTFVLRV
jgi:hypothetical protein